MAIYAICVAVSIPGATILTLTGGFLFGTLFGTVFIVLSATIGASMIFFATKTAFAEIFTKKAGPFLQKLEKGFQNNAFSYLLVLRLVPLFPFWLINIVPAVLNVRFKTFFIATLFGIIPGTAVYASIGNGLGAIFDQDQTPNLGIIFQPNVLLPLLALALLSIVPVVYKKLKKKSS